MRWNARQLKCFLKKVEMNAPKECWEWKGAKNLGGYGCANGVSAHRAMMELVMGPLPAGKLVCHRCDNPSCCNPDHLFLGSQKDNLQDAAKKGRMSRGERRYNSKLTKDKVMEARRLHKEGWSLDRLSGRYSVSAGTIQSAVLKLTWKHIES